ncbi:MAG: hypothetical protein BWY19_00712 [bacterium ADurb.Bin212]|nr:MAG: hypothetical protein BWY19_00712 [bacterium ADurb.Bin212]
MKRIFLVVVVVAVVVSISVVKYGGDRLHRAPDKFDERSILHMLLEIETPREMAEKFVRPGWMYYRPLGLASLWLDRQISSRPRDGSMAELTASETAYRFRCTDLAWHIVGALAFGWMLAVLLASPLAGGIGAILYAAAPANGFTAGWFAARFDLISAPAICATVACFFLHLRAEGKRSRWWLAGSAAAMMIGLMSKENTLVAPAFISLAVILLSGQQGWSWRKAVTGVVGIWGIAVAYIALRAVMIPGFMDPGAGAMVGTEAFWRLTARMYLAPIEWLIVTAKAYAGSDAWILLNPGFWGDITKLVAVTASAVVFRHRWQLALVLWAWVLVFYLPVAPIYSYNRFPHYLALPSAGYSALAALIGACWLTWLYERWPIWQPRLALWATPRLSRPARAPSR